MARSYRPHDRHEPSPPHILPPVPQVELEIVRGRARRRVRPVGGPAFLIGAAADSDLVLGDVKFPEAHSYLLVSAEGVAVRWLGFGPTLSVNDRPVTDRALLADGDLLRTGPYEFRITIHDRRYDDGSGRGALLRPRPSSGWSDAESDQLPSSGEIEDLLADIRQTLRSGQEVGLVVAARSIPQGADAPTGWRFFAGRLARRRGA